MAEGLTLTVDTLRSIRSEVDKIDEQLDAASGSSAAGRRKIVNELIDKHSDIVEQVNTGVSQNFDKYDTETLSAVMNALQRTLNERYGKKVDEYLDAQVEERKNSQEKVSLTDQQVESLTETRKKKVEEFNAVRSVLEMMGIDGLDSIETPKGRRGKSGKRGPQALSTYQYAINGENLSGDENDLKTVAKRAGKEVRPFKAWLKEAQKFDEAGEPISFEFKKGSMPDFWAVEVPVPGSDPITLTATRLPEYVGTDAPDASQTDEGDEDENEEE